MNGVTKPFAGVVIEPWAMFPSFLEHEMGHGYGLEHAFSNASCGASGVAGEYCDPYDAMGVSWNGLEFSQPAYALRTAASARPVQGWMRSSSTSSVSSPRVAV